MQVSDTILLGNDSLPTHSVSKRKRGDHDVTCKCPFPVWFAPESYKPLPGEFGHAMNKLVKRDKATGKHQLRRSVSRDPYFVFLREAAGRQRNFRPERRALIDAIFPLLIQRADLGSWVVTMNVSRLAEELSPKDEQGKVIADKSVTPSRLSRLLQELARYGLCELPDLEWDPIDNYWMPRHLVLTERFWQLCGVNMDKLLMQRNQRLEAEAEGIIVAGSYESIKAARAKWFDKMRMATLVHRREQAFKEKKRKRLGKMPLDDRRNAMASWLIKTRPNHELRNMGHDVFDRLVWQNLNQLELGLERGPRPPKTTH